MTTHWRQPKPEYTLHCFVVARAARQFFGHARFDPMAPKARTETYRKLIRKVVRRNPRKISAPGKRVVIPGYANLREFSEAHEAALKAECGSAWESYFQRGHWRMLFPFSRRHQERMAEQLQVALAQHRPPIVHVVRFPSLTINHALLIFDCEETGEAILFAAYDPNVPEQPTALRFDGNSRTFSLPANQYFHGGRVDVYEVYHSVHY
jgi:hypothetical protein